MKLFKLIVASSLILGTCGFRFKHYKEETCIPEEFKKLLVNNISCYFNKLTAELIETGEAKDDVVYRLSVDETTQRWLQNYIGREVMVKFTSEVTDRGVVYSIEKLTCCY